MNIKTTRLGALTLGLLFLGSTLQISAQGTAFTYQGRLNSGANPASGIYDLRFALYDALVVGTQQGVVLTNTATAVTNGLFTVTLDFGNQFPSANRWLEIGVRTNGGGAFTPLSPRQPLTPTPYALFATTAGIAGNFTGSLAGDVTGTQSATVVGNVGGYGAATVASGASAANAAGSANVPGTIVKRDGLGNFSAGNITATFTGNGAGLTSVSVPTTNLVGTITGSQIAPGAISTSHLNTPGGPLSGQVLGYNGSGLTWANNSALGSWLLTGNPSANLTNGTFLGTTDNFPLEFKVNGQRALRIEYATNTFYGDSPNIVGGYSANIISNGVVGGFIGGGGGYAYPNYVAGNFATVVGGANNNALGNYSTAMGGGSVALGDYSIAGGASTASGQYAFAVGSESIASGNYSTAIGFHAVSFGSAAMAVGSLAQAINGNTFVWSDGSSGTFSSTAANQFLIHAAGGVGININNPNGAALAVNGNETLTGNLNFSSALGQRLNLLSTNYGIGVQSASLYFRCNTGATDGFIWYKGGAHNDAYANAGGGVELMHLIQGALYVNGTFVSSSDRNAKENFQPVDPQSVLAKVTALPLSRWNYKADPAQLHIGPMAQDFYAAFGVGPDDKHIATVDEGGVALAAIQGLNEKLEARSQKLEAENASLKARLEKLEQLLLEKH